jgi:energy-coupling factor transporter ATP-binding protein EcfA2
MAERGFPNELLKQSIHAREAHFTGFTVAHPVLTEASLKLTRAISRPVPGSLILVYGPTGSGKTTLRRRTEQRITAQLQPELEANPGRVPIVSLDAISASKHSFNWTDFFRRLLIELKEPCVGHKKLPEHFNDALHIRINERSSETIMRLAAEQTIELRDPLAVIIDEAQHLGKLVSGRQLLDQLDAVKSFATMTAKKIVMIGTYELLPFRNLSGQLSRRSIDVHLRRYNARVPGDIEAFVNVLWTFQRQLPLEEEPDLVANWEFFYERSIGCVGTLKDWLTTALHTALDSGQQTLTKEVLEDTALTTDQCDKQLNEALAGENLLAAKPATRAALREGLGLEAWTTDNNSTEPNSGNNKGQSERPPASSTKSRPGQRNAIRDPVGYKSGDFPVQVV